ncbi:MAG: sporulation protein YqfD, partial [Oscillospiraceae bacterium]
MYWEFFNFLIDNEFYITDICSTDIGFTAICLARDYHRIARTAKKFQCRTKVLQRKGVYFHCKNILKRKGILLGTVLFFIAITLYNNIIWSIDISAPTPNIKEDIYSLLYINNIYAGSVFSQEKHRAAVQDIFMKVDNIGYVTLNFSKGLISCKVEEKIEKLPYLAGQFSGDIIATADGVIADLRVYKGFSKVTMGQTVAKGDLLVSAAEVNKRGE